MDGPEVVAAVREAAATELDRLGSEKALIAATGADLDTAAVLRAAADAEARARATFGAWADDEDHDAAGEAFADAAAAETDHHERVVAELDAEPDAAGGSPPDAASDTEAGPDPGTASGADPLHDYLRGLDGPAERVGAGLVGRSLVASRSLLQFVNFFVNEGATREADLFRELRRDTDETVERGGAVLDAVCESEDEYERAREAAVEAVRIAYGEYTRQLEGMGLDPKPVC